MYPTSGNGEGSGKSGLSTDDDKPPETTTEGIEEAVIEIDNIEPISLGEDRRSENES